MYKGPSAHTGMYWRFCFLKAKTQKRALWIIHSSTPVNPSPAPLSFLCLLRLPDFHGVQELSGHSTFLSRPSGFQLSPLLLLVARWVNWPLPLHAMGPDYLWGFDSRTTLNMSLLSSGRHIWRSSLLDSFTFCSLLHLRNLLIAPPTPQKYTVPFFSFGRMTSNLGIDPFHGLQLIFDPSHHYYWSNLLVSVSYLRTVHSSKRKESCLFLIESKGFLLNSYDNPVQLTLLYPFYGWGS